MTKLYAVWGLVDYQNAALRFVSESKQTAEAVAAWLIDQGDYLDDVSVGELILDELDYGYTDMALGNILRWHQEQSDSDSR